jgi:shikimate kinase
MKSSVILIGAPGVGKTKLGEEVAKSQNFDFIDGDRAMIDYIIEREGTNSDDPVAEKLKQLGDRGFLDFEHQFYMDRFPQGL